MQKNIDQWKGNTSGKPDITPSKPPGKIGKEIFKLV